ncbi:MAG: TlpA family protein disulfide reductase [Pirellula sp.]|jgi:thiol-disulfide isomerase/thioredoxin|nr:TlpA family protein disulfide reductase [Pirellula sp.]
MNTETAPSKARFAKPAYLPLFLACLFMVIGTVVLVVMGREESRLRGMVLGELDLKPLLYASKPIEPADIEDKIVVLHFWGFWCVPCLKEYPEIARIQKEYLTSQDVMFLSIATSDNSSDTEDQLVFRTKKFLDQAKIDDMPIYWDPAEFTRTQVSRMFKSGGFVNPTTIVLDRQGKVFNVWRGPVEVSSLKSSIEKARKQKT